MSIVLLGVFISACIIAVIEAYESYPLVRAMRRTMPYVQQYVQQYGRRVWSPHKGSPAFDAFLDAGDYRRFAKLPPRLRLVPKHDRGAK